MKKVLSATVEPDVIEELNRLHDVTMVNKSQILDVILKIGMNDIRKLNDDFKRYKDERLGK